MDAATLFSVLQGGLVLGARYALMATGFSLVWTTLGIFNFAHGAFVVLGAYIAWQFSSADAWNLPLLPAILLTSVIMTLAASAILENGLLLIWGPRSKQIPPLGKGEVTLGQINLATSEVILLVLVLSILLVGGTGTIWGPVIAAFAISVLPEWLSGFGAWQNIIIAVAIILVVVFYPGGLWAALQELREALDALRTSLMARWQRRDAQAREDRLGTVERFIETKYGTIAVADTEDADKPALLFLHGNSACKEAFYKQFQAFRDMYRVISFDYPRSQPFFIATCGARMDGRGCI
ncbi:hypothetical protein [Ruegeria sp.]|uniref:ABC transporter permease subunit n=1 Tax=Ruegeria sp. TaxID=1879320 RepID=UPI0023164E95|nr:hypothetical protein [Ruegeria sp.]MDA7966523.1 hypothetical protein [Ruegeria sp.]